MEDWKQFVPTLSSISHRCTKLMTESWDVLDGCLKPDWAAALASECLHLEEKGLLQPHRFEFAANGDRVEYQHPGRSFVDLEAPKISPSVAAAAPGLAHFASEAAPLLATQLLQEMPGLALKQPSGVQVKLQLTKGQGSAPCHYDTSETAPHRQVTLLLYLSEGYQENYGTELVLQPFLGCPVKVSPIFNRGVIFLSDRVLHYTLPPTEDGTTFARWLLTIWLDGDQVDKAVGQTQRWPPLLQRLLAPAIYPEMFLKSLEQSMPPGAALKALKLAQEEEIASIELDDSFAEMLPDLKEAAAAADMRKTTWKRDSDDSPMSPRSPRRGSCKRVHSEPASTWNRKMLRQYGAGGNSNTMEIIVNPSHRLFNAYESPPSHCYHCIAIRPCSTAKARADCLYSHPEGGELDRG